MLKKWMRSTRWRFILCVIITNLLSSILTVFVWLPLSQNLFSAGHVLAHYIPMVIATLAAIPISSAISLHSAKPIQDMLEATKSISKGDYSVRVAEGGEGDIGELLHSFNQMTAELGSTELMRNDFINTFSHEFKPPSYPSGALPGGCAAEISPGSSRKNIWSLSRRNRSGCPICPAPYCS